MSKLTNSDFEAAIEEIEFIDKLDEKQKLIKEYEQQISTIKTILYRHALFSNFQFAQQEFKNQLDCLNNMFESFKNTL